VQVILLPVPLQFPIQRKSRKVLMEEVIFEIRRWEFYFKRLSLPEPMSVLMEEERWGRLHDYRWGILLSPLG
jgi:hypothetical protein